MGSVHDKNKEIVNIAIGIAALIGGGMGIYAISGAFPIPGAKFMLMAPYLSIVLYVIQVKVQTKFVVLKLGLVFALIMTFINLFMGLAIIMTTLLTQLSIMSIRNLESRVFWGSVLFSAYTGLCALVVTKTMIGGVVASVPYSWLVLASFLCGCFGVIGTKVAKRILRYMEIRIIS